jgi:hypothetical protein
MLIVALGCSGLGLVWGWLIGSLDRWCYRSARNIFALIISTLLLVAEAILFAGWRFLPLFLGAIALAVLFHFVWNYYLYRRFRPGE